VNWEHISELITPLPLLLHVLRVRRAENMPDVTRDPTVYNTKTRSAIASNLTGLYKTSITSNVRDNPPP
jgi:hypothetical protein